MADFLHGPLEIVFGAGPFGQLKFATIRGLYGVSGGPIDLSLILMQTEYGACKDFDFAKYLPIGRE
ncbi:uncharacterized protein PGTG_15707 [Puccinia graminis f. sp. tritici CRL 75-36-700-3]|uniref:Uncharacterized protein n=1 Tax=Puccinia graminis f. sp. tritici (strain CRL 75-36-700-3 / race SCCL) TaxID=418459 RepID=E3KZ33_PUCGT|nr:uncharacterized protein PGTG_15707 [Puccinia graminis f. sp. tritici CRL 75-36-700-3]EFP89558.2 hypothetical protein PGTG_15707 [Puccinia graminis f. sp. tritici CRL 75-36-700-3]